MILIRTLKICSYTRLEVSICEVLEEFKMLYFIDLAHLVSGPCLEINIMGGSKGGASPPPPLAHVVGFLTLGPKLDPLFLPVDLRWTPPPFSKILDPPHNIIVTLRLTPSIFVLHRCP